MRRSEFMMGGLDFNGLITAQIMEKEVVSARLNTPWRDMAHTMTELGFGSVPIVDDNNNLKGVVTEYDLLKVLMESKDVAKITAKDIMTKNPICATEDTHASALIDILETKHLIRLPVIKNGKLVGVVARRDVLLAYLNATVKPPGTL